MSCVVRGALFAVAFLLMTEHATVGSAYESTSPEAAIRAMVRANAELDMPTLSRLMAHDTDIISYTIGGRKYVGWPEFEHDMKEEFSSVAKLEIPIHELKVWTTGSLAWLTLAARCAVPPWSGWSFFINRRYASRISSRLAPG